MVEAKRDDEEGAEGPRPPPDIQKLLELFRGPIDIRSIALTGTFLLLVLYTLYFARPFLLPIVLAILLNFLLSPIVRGLSRLRIPQGIGAGIVLAALLGGIGYGLYRLSDPAASWVEKVPEGIQRVERRIRDAEGPVQDVRRAAEQVEEQVDRMAGRDARPEVEIQGRSLSGVVLGQTQEFLAGALVMTILLYFLLASGDLFLRKLVRVLPRLRDKKAAIEIARATEHHISTYLSTITLINLGLGVAVGLAMALVGMPNPVLWGVLAGVLNYVPYLGPLVTVGILALVSLLTFEALGRALVAPLVYLGINLLEAYLVTPMLLGRRLTLNPVVVFLGLIFWGWMWGIVGALLAVPILATFKIFCDHIEPLSPIGEFLGK